MILYHVFYFPEIYRYQTLLLVSDVVFMLRMTLYLRYVIRNMVISTDSILVPSVQIRCCRMLRASVRVLGA